MKTLKVLLFALAVLTYVHSYNMDRSDREIEELFRWRLHPRQLEVKKTDKRGKSVRFLLSVPQRQKLREKGNILPRFQETFIHDLKHMGCQQPAMSVHKSEISLKVFPSTFMGSIV